jgi:hypothetical protein
VQRLAFVKQATVSGWQWLVDVSNQAGALALVMLVIGISAFSAVKLPHWWLGLVILAGCYAVLFAEGAFRIHRESTEELRQLRGIDALFFAWDRSKTGREHPFYLGTEVHMSKYFHATVQARARATACSGHLLRVEWQDADGVFQEIAHFDNAQLLDWHNMGSAPVDIESDIPRHINLVCTESRSGGRIILCVASHEPRGVPTVLDPGRYRLTVRVKGENTEPIYARFLVSSGETYKTLEAEQTTDPPEGLYS